MSKNNLLLLLIFLFINYILSVSTVLSENIICNNDSDCLNFGQCKLLPDSFTGKLKKQCNCETNFSGTKCEFQKCPEDPCKNNGICELTNSANKFKCHCPLGYSGSLCETKIPNACDTKICINGRCRLDGSADKGICDCFYGFEGEICDTKTLCDPASCSGHGTCSNNGTSINCLCDPGWHGERCDIDVNECKNDAKLCKHGTCINSLGSYFCRCFDGYVGVHCEKEAASNGCSSMPCQNGGTCLSKIGSDFTCKCPPGFAGNLCEENINDCERYDDPNFGDAGKNLSKCTNGGSCIDGNNEFYCVCPNGFTGKDCRQNIDECNIFGTGLCQNGGSCIDTYGTFQCACIYGFEGKYCEINVNDCENNLCYNGSKCIDKIRSYECECEADRIGVFCQFENPCIEKNNKCQNGQCFADSTNGNFSCFCDKGFSGEFCNIDINECETQSPCYKGKCINHNGGYKCECEKGYAGINCDILIDECEGRPCLNGGTCIDLAGDFKCICMPSWNGRNCEIPKPYSPACNKLMCMHGGICRKNPFGEEFCQCSSRFTGKNCELIKLDPCEGNKCSGNSEKCLPTNNYNSYTCQCKNGYAGKYCEEKVQSCNDNPCFVGNCLNTANGFQCQCPQGYKGINCEININECKQNLCGGGICVDEVNGYSCKCPATHFGKHCENPVTDPCQNDPCLNNGICMTYNIHGSFICKCQNGFTGRNCEIRTDICDSTKCQNGGYCTPGDESCQCGEGFNGRFCEKDQNKCSKVICQNGGSCENLDNDFVCKCPYAWPYGYAGRYCQEKVNIEKYKPEETKEKEECQRNECEKLAKNGKCDEECNFPGCNYDGGDCSASNPQPFGNCSYASFCKYVFRDDHCDEICNNEGCLFDGFDCQEKTPSKCFIEAQCLKDYGNGICNPECNSAECGWDGGDCIEKKEELKETLVLTLITDSSNFIENIASKLLIVLSQLLHASVHYQLDPSGNPMIYEWNSRDGQGSIIPASHNSNTIQKRFIEEDVKKGVKIYLTIDVSVCQQLSSLKNALQIEVYNENQKCFTETQSAADMLAADSTKKTFDDLSIGIADATVMPRSTTKSSTPLIYIIFAVIGVIILVIALYNTASLRPVKRKFVTIRKTFFPPTSEELKNREKQGQQLYATPYGNQYDRESLMAAANLTGSTLLSSNGELVEPITKKFREEQPQRVFTKLHELAASDLPISNEQIQQLSMCASVKDPKNGQNCIHWAVESRAEKSDANVIEDIKKLVAVGCPIDDVDESGATALHLAIRNGRKEVATFLFGHIDVNIQDDNGRTVLYDAVATKSLEMVQKILSMNNVDVNVVAYVNDTALMQCCRMGNEMFPIAKALLSHPRIEIDKTGNKSELQYSGKTAIHEAAACNSTQILKLLINRGAILTVHDVHEQTPLFLAVKSNQIEAVKLLINHMRAVKVEINASNDCGETPLQIAISKGFTEIVELLQNAGAQMPNPACFQVFPSLGERSKFPKMKAVSESKGSAKISPNPKKQTASKKRKADNVGIETTQQQFPNNPMVQQQQQQEYYPLNNPMVQMPPYDPYQMNPQMIQHSVQSYPQIQQLQLQQQQQQCHPEYYQQQQQQPLSNYSSNPPSAHQLPQCSSTSPYISGDSAYGGSPNSYQNSLTNTSGQSDGSNFASPPNSYDTGLWQHNNSSPDTVISNNTSNTVTPIQQQNCPPSKQDYPVYSDNFYPVSSAQQQQYPHYNWNSSYPHNLYNSATNLQHYPPAYSQPQAYYRNHPQQRPPHIPYPEGNQSMMHRSASFAAFPTQ